MKPWKYTGAAPLWWLRLMRLLGRELKRVMTMIVKYRTGGWGKSLIEEIEVERETDSSVWIKGSRNAKNTTYHKYWDTWEDAYAHLLEKAENKLTSARRALERAQGEYGNIKGMKAP